MGKIKKTINSLKLFFINLSIKKTLVFIIALMVFITFICFIITVVLVRPLRDVAIQEQKNIIDFFLYFVILIYSITFIVFGVIIFYKIKLDKPLKLIVDATEKISNNNLDFELKYLSQDEMGKLCSSFEKMRVELYNNNINMWRVAEERKKVNAVFAHDLRTPITVLKGYTDFLTEYILTDKFNKDKLLSSISTMSEHIIRIENYIYMMNTIHTLEDTPININVINSDLFIEKLTEVTNQLSNQFTKEITINNIKIQNILNIDCDIVLRVLENIILNACQYAKNKIEINIITNYNILIFNILDDGEGFDNILLEQGLKPFYKGKNSKGSLGMGLSICDILCKNHGGSIKLENNLRGAKITISFLMKVDKK